MSRTNNSLSPKQKEDFDQATHLFATNEFVKLLKKNAKIVKPPNST